MTYRENPALNQSKLKAILKSAFYYRKFEKDQLDPSKNKKSFFDLGDVTEGLLMSPFGWYEENYHTGGDYNKESKLYQIVEHIYNAHINVMDIENIPSHFKSVEKVSILEACVKHTYQNKWKPETKVNKILTLGEGIWTDLIEAKGRILLSKDDYNKALDLSILLKSHPSTNHWFNKQPKIDLYYKQPIYFKYLGIDCKAEIDMVKIDHTKLLVYLGDLKTTAFDVIGFPKQALKLNYVFQAAWYKLAMETYLKDRGLVEKGYKLAPHTDTESPFTFVVAHTLGMNTYPMSWQCSKNDLLIGKVGLDKVNDHYLSGEDLSAFTKKHKVVRGYDEAMELFLYYKEHGNNMDKVIRENNGLLTLNLFNNER